MNARSHDLHANRMHADGMQMIRSQLCQAVMRLESESRYLSDEAVTRRMRDIERVATEHGLTPLARVARAGVHAVAAPRAGSNHRHALACHLSRMEDAAGCSGPDEAATAAILASIAVRLG